MKAKLVLIILSAIFVTSACSRKQVHGEEVTYTAGGVTMKGYVAYDPAVTTKRPGILVVHEWWGNDAYSRKRADMLAELGYTALAVDMYGEGKHAENPDEAGKLAGEIKNNIELSKTRFDAAMEFLKSQATVDSSKIAAIGYCFGGGVALNNARLGADLKAVVSFHGDLKPAKVAEKGKVKAKLLVAQGGADGFVPEKDVEAIKKEMADAGADLTVTVYPGATHVFTNPAADEYARKFKMPIAYNPEGDKKSWEEMKGFLAGALK
ncbi:MAG: dienelactone hydrolase family protein [Spirochaetia bacterium]|nr:dienelactone hydrolase family protein [Spirochaetia bacterium]